MCSSDLPDTTNVWKANLAFDASWTTQVIDGAGAQDNVYLAEFGGTLSTNDYVIVDRNVISTASRSSSGTTRTIVTAVPHGLATGSLVTIVGMGNTNYNPTIASTTSPQLNGQNIKPLAVSITVVNSTTFTYTFGGASSLTEASTADTAGVVSSAEVFKVASLINQVSKKFSVVNGCDSVSPKTIFEVDSVTGDIKLGDPTVQTSITNLYGSLKLNGGCGATAIANDIFNPDYGTSDDSKLVLSNQNFNTVEFNTCNGNTVLGNQWAWVWAQSGLYGQTAVAHSTSSPVYVYTRAPQSIQANGPLTTLADNISANQITPIKVNSISGFSKGDLVLIVDGTSKFEIIRVTAAPYTDGSGFKWLPVIYNAEYPAGTYPNGGRGQEGTTGTSFNAGAVVVKILKNSATTTLLEALPATGRTQAPSPNTSPTRIVLKLANGDLVRPKLDYEQLIRIDNEFFLPDSITGAVDVGFSVKLPKSIRSSFDANSPEANINRYYGGGRLTVHDDVIVSSGNIRMYGSDGQTLIFNVANDDGHPLDGSILDPVTGRSGMYLNGNAEVYGSLKIYNQVCVENGTCTNDLKLQIFNTTGSVNMGEKLYISGKISATESASTALLHIDNIGSAGTNAVGPKDFIMYQDGSIDAFGISRY